MILNKKKLFIMIIQSIQMMKTMKKMKMMNKKMKKTSMTKNKIKQQQIKYKVSYKLMKINNLEKS